MRRFLVQVLLTSVVVLCSLDSPPLSEDMLRRLSAAGEEYVDEEIKQAILGVKRAKETMGKKEETHRELMHALRQSSDKKMGAMQLAKETEQKLEEAEQKCRDLTKSSFRRCQPCLEDSCKAFYTSTCRRGYASFSFKVEEFFRKMAAQLEDGEDEQRENPGRTIPAENQVMEDRMDSEILQAEGSFSELLSEIGLVYNHSIIIAKRMEQVFGQSFLAAFTSDLQQNSLSATQADPNQGFFKTFGLDHILESAYDLGRDFLEEISSTVADVFGEIQEAEEYLQQPSRDTGRYLCRQLRRQASECWQLRDLCETCKNDLVKECPLLQPLHSELDEMHTLLNASRQQYNYRLQLVRRHTADTQRWLRGVQDKYGWLSQLSNTTAGPRNIFRVIGTNPQQQMKNNQLTSESSVVVSILDSTPITVVVPADLAVDEPAFIQHVTEEALTRQKQQIRGTK